MGRIHRRYSVMLAAICIVNIVANLAAVKIVKFPLLNVPVDCGIYVFPIGYVLTDLLQDKYGRREANYVTRLSLLFSVATMIVLAIMTLIPPYPGWENNEAFKSIYGMTARVTIASAIAYLSRFINNEIFAEMRMRRKSFFRSSMISTLVAQIVDTAIFETVAFFGVLPLADFIKQAGFAFIAAIALEAIATIIATFIRENFFAF